MKNKHIKKMLKEIERIEDEEYEEIMNSSYEEVDKKNQLEDNNFKNS